MPICPVDLEPCERRQCSGGHCMRTDAAALSICWECGALESDGIAAGICVACLAVYVAEGTPTEG